MARLRRKLITKTYGLKRYNKNKWELVLEPGGFPLLFPNEKEARETAAMLTKPNMIYEAIKLHIQEI